MTVGNAMTAAIQMLVFRTCRRGIVFFCNRMSRQASLLVYNPAGNRSNPTPDYNKRPPLCSRRMIPEAEAEEVEKAVSERLRRQQCCSD